MDIKLVILLAVAIAIIFLLMNEMSALREEIDKKMSELNNRITKYNDDTRIVFKKETSDMTAKFKTYMTDTIKELRTMNHIENQIITHMSDQFAEADSFDRPGMPHLSDMNPNSRYKKNTSPIDINPAQKAESDTVVINTRTHNPMHNVTHSNRKSIDDELYMSPKSDDFKVKENGKALSSMTDTEAEDVEEDAEDTEPVEDAEDTENAENAENVEDVEDVEDAENAEDLDRAADTKQTKTESSKVGTSKASASKADAKTKAKLETYRKIRASMEDDEDTVSSENITFGSTNKGVQITVKGIKTKKSDDGETDDTNESESHDSHDETDITTASNADVFRLKSISRYSKQDLVNIAREKGIIVTERSNKTDIYNTIRNSL